MKSGIVSHSFSACSEPFLLLIISDLGLTASIEIPHAEAVDSKSDEFKADECKCEKHFKPMDCSEIFENGNTESGIYTIWPRNRLANCSSLEVYCDMDTAGGGWTLIQRRGDFGNGEDYFAKNWEQYKAGFGDLKKEFWIGNDNIFIITNQAQYSIRFDMTHGNGKTAFTHYENFWIDDEDKMYLLHISEASGPGGGAISNHDQCPFYTRDRPNRLDGKVMEKVHSGGWWNNAWPSSNLNGLNLNGQKITDVDGIQWMNFGGFYNSLAATEMKVRPKRFHAK
ncbi:techylectin-5A [Caerostris extrusa]|uniref:Techylectin-5A n=1 Tax=Caerostris extrusa TaxID=172846 RepID=A0AAV4NFP1_CAEEX|nr:techylectin-5A [Caerostris extrusa]